MESILNFDAEFNTELFDELIRNAFDSTSPRHSDAEAILVQFQEHPSAWTRVDQILSQSKEPQAQFLALQILEHVIKARWPLFTPDQRSGLKNYVVQAVLFRANQSDKRTGSDALILNKLNIILVEILKKEWPKHWPTFVNDLITASQSMSMEVCRNSLDILRRLNEEIFIFSSITTVRKRMLQNQLCAEFPEIFQLIKTILESARRMNISERLIEATLSALTSFIRCMPTAVDLDTQVVDYVIGYLNSAHSIAALCCLYEIIENGTESGIQHALPIHTSLISFLSLYFSKFNGSSVHKHYTNMDEQEKNFIAKAAILLSSLYEKRLDLLEKEDLNSTLQGLKYLLEFSKIDRVFNLRFWNVFVYKLYSEFPFNKKPVGVLRRTKYNSILNALIEVLVLKMPRPEEVLVVENEYGEIVKEKMVETEKIEQYRLMRSTLFHLSFLTREKIMEYFITRMDAQLQGTEWSWSMLNRVCWSIGCISGAFEESEESSFFVAILKDLLGLCELKIVKDDKAVIASNILYVVGQYHRFLKANERFFKTVVKKLFEFMNEKHEGIQDMACDTFLKIANKCCHNFLTTREGGEVYLIHILKNTNSITRSLEFYQKRIVYEALCVIIAEMKMGTQSYPPQKLVVIDLLFSLFGKSEYNKPDFNILNPNFNISNANREVLKGVSHMLKSYTLCYEKIPDSITPSFTSVFPRLFEVYEKANGENLIKIEIINLFVAVIKGLKFIVDGRIEGFLNSLFERFIFDYKNMQEGVILDLASEIIIYENTNVSNDNILAINRYQFIISTLIQPSIPLVMNGGVIIPSYLKLFHSLINAPSFYSLVFSDQLLFDSIYNSFLYCLTCTRESSDLSISIIRRIFEISYELKNFTFFRKYYLITLENMLGILFDKDSHHGFEEQCSLAEYLMSISDNIGPLDNSGNNWQAINEFINGLFFVSFPNITRDSLELFKIGLKELRGEPLREHIQDFGVKVYEYASDEYLEEEMGLLEERKRICKNVGV
ncbi:Exportin-1 [Astathelohania contejeani]|uniref:Exportin-1 n=1 Tax=Astathelohania contejeani TaxID=164912 RepID=A0ABQ7HYD1_9MICR|nr:Exportin-1 [Thelohania contejeani]